MSYKKQYRGINGLDLSIGWTSSRTAQGEEYYTKEHTPCVYGWQNGATWQVSEPDSSGAGLGLIFWTRAGMGCKLQIQLGSALGSGSPKILPLWPDTTQI